MRLQAPNIRCWRTHEVWATSLFFICFGVLDRSVFRCQVHAEPVHMQQMPVNSNVFNAEYASPNWSHEGEATELQEIQHFSLWKDASARSISIFHE